MAEQAVAEFLSAKKTISLTRVARQYGADVEKRGKITIYIFLDDSCIEVEGRGKGHTFTTFHP